MVYVSSFVNTLEECVRVRVSSPAHASDDICTTNGDMQRLEQTAEHFLAALRHPGQRRDRRYCHALAVQGAPLNRSAASAAAPDRWLAPDRGQLWGIARVTAVFPGTEGTTTLRLRLAEDLEFLPGQYYLVRLAVESPPGVVEQAYSASSSPFPVSPEFEITVQEVPGGRASPHLVHDVRTGDQLHVCGPFGLLTWTEADASPPILIGAGSGMAPLISMVRYAAARRARTPMTVLCSSRDRSAVLFREALEVLDRDQPWLSVVHTFTRSADDPYARYHRRIDSSMIDEVTRSTSDAEIGDSSFLVAGPAAMVASVRAALCTLGVPDARVNSENHA